MTIREIQKTDYENLINFWKANYFVSEMDSEDRFQLFLKKNPDLSILVEVDNKIIGTALVSFDGRRGYLQKLVVDKSTRNKGVGKLILERVVTKLKSLGVVYIPIAVEKDLVNFYEQCGFKVSKQISMRLDLGNKF